MGMTFNPISVMMKQPSQTGVPYIGGNTSGPITKGPFTEGGTARPMPPNPMPAWGGQPPMAGGGKSFGGSTPAPQPNSQNVVGPESIRATGAGPFDSAYRQDLATFAGGLFGRPGGNLSFNPTGNQPFGGAAVGGGNAPIFGMPNTLLQNALGGNPFSFTPPAPTTGAVNNQPNTLNMMDWWNRFMNQGKGQRIASQ